MAPISVFCQVLRQLQSQQNRQRRIPTQPEPCQQPSPELCPQHLRPDELTRIVVMMSVLFASVSETLISRLVEFMAKVLLEYQIPI